MSDYLIRKIDKKIEEWDESNNKALLILGARQVGKTHSIRHFIRSKYKLDESDNIAEINVVEYPRFIDLLTKETPIEGLSFIDFALSELNIVFDEKIKIVFIDEIQALSNDKKTKATLIIKDVINRILSNSNYKFIFSGSLLGSKISNLDVISDEINELETIKMYPIDYEEFVQNIDKDYLFLEEIKKEIINGNIINKSQHIHALERFSEYSFVGGMPVAVKTYKTNYSASEANDAIASLIDLYNQDIQKYYREEYEQEIAYEVFDSLLYGLDKNNKQKFMNERFKNRDRKLFYKYIIDSDVGLLVEEKSEIGKSIDDQNSPKTFFNDVGFLRGLIFSHAKKANPNLTNLDIETEKNALIDWINGKKKSFSNQGKFFEQVVAQELKAHNFSFSYHYLNSNKTHKEQEIEFIINKNFSGIEVKSGDFEKYNSANDYAKSGNLVYFLTLLPYIGTFKNNIIALPIYSICLLSEQEVLSLDKEELSEEGKNVFESGRLPNNEGFYFNR